MIHKSDYEVEKECESKIEKRLREAELEKQKIKRLTTRQKMKTGRKHENVKKI